MAAASEPWWKRPDVWIEVFVILNVGFLTLDIYLAHSVNQFRSHAEYIPLFFSAIAPVFLILGLSQRAGHPLAWKILGHLVGWAAIVVGCTGVIFHLESHFFYERTIRSLTYSAPFAAPLAYAGLGFLLVMNRMVPARTIEWSRWVLLFTLGGFFGNFIFSLADHAGNGFFSRAEWVPVAASALAIGFLFVPLVTRVSRSFLDLCAVVLALEAGVGLWGFVLHTAGNLQGPSIHAFDNFIYGAPPLAPLLFPNLMLLGVIGLWCLRTVESA
jgi:hypothetical protein